MLRKILHFGCKEELKSAYGKNPKNEDNLSKMGNPQPSSKDDASAHLWMQFRDLMSVGQRRLERQNNKSSMSWHKIKSVHVGTRSV